MATYESVEYMLELYCKRNDHILSSDKKITLDIIESELMSLEYIIAEKKYKKLIKSDPSKSNMFCVINIIDDEYEFVEHEDDAHDKSFEWQNSHANQYPYIAGPIFPCYK